MALHLIPWAAAGPDVCRRGAVTIGNFDGVHRGHQALLAELRACAQTAGGPAVALTFDPHPLRLLRPDQPMPVLTTLADRAGLLHRAGVDHVVILRTTPAMLQLRATEFYDQVLRGNLQVRALVEGANFAFGHNREGTIDTLAELCRRDGLPLAVVPPFAWLGGPVSSSRIRATLREGDVEQAADLLSRPYRVWGLVGAGAKRGRALGFPTANLEQIVTLIPADGVYAVRVLRQGRRLPGAANVGPNPTFGEQVRKVEVHLLDFDGDLYGEELAVEFIARLRDTRKFAGVDELTAQLRVDVEQARRVLAPVATGGSPVAAGPATGEPPVATNKKGE